MTTKVGEASPTKVSNSEQDEMSALRLAFAQVEEERNRLKAIVQQLESASVERSLFDSTTEPASGSCYHHCSPHTFLYRLDAVSAEEQREADHLAAEELEREMRCIESGSERRWR